MDYARRVNRQRIRPEATTMLPIARQWPPRGASPTRKIKYTRLCDKRSDLEASYDPPPELQAPRDTFTTARACFNAFLILLGLYAACFALVYFSCLQACADETIIRHAQCSGVVDRVCKPMIWVLWLVCTLFAIRIRYSRPDHFLFGYLKTFGAGYSIYFIANMVFSAF
ncbi:hypothetical protein F4802DRAFT_36708 [Xylaria palmicola]|nr:hypothetical protein F4802DRAFT_36708 [Xylaria palmicola]